MSFLEKSRSAFRENSLSSGVRCVATTFRVHPRSLGHSKCPTLLSSGSLGQGVLSWPIPCDLCFCLSPPPGPGDPAPASCRAPRNVLGGKDSPSPASSLQYCLNFKLILLDNIVTRHISFVISYIIFCNKWIHPPPVCPPPAS